MSPVSSNVKFYGSGSQNLKTMSELRTASITYNMRDSKIVSGLTTLVYRIAFLGNFIVTKPGTHFQNAKFLFNEFHFSPGIFIPKCYQKSVTCSPLFFDMSRNQPISYNITVPILALLYFCIHQLMNS